MLKMATQLNMGLTLREYPHSRVLGSVGLENLVPKKEMFFQKVTMMPLKWKLRLPPGHLGFFMPLNPQAKKGITLLAGATDANYKWKTCLLLHPGNKESI